MSPLEALREVQKIFEERGEVFDVLPPAAEERISALERVGIYFPQPILDLLKVTSGVDLGPKSNGPLRFCSDTGDTYWDFLFPNCIVIGENGSGNQATIDVANSEESWGPIFYIYEAMYVILLCWTMEEFILSLPGSDWYGESGRQPIKELDEGISNMEIHQADPNLTLSAEDWLTKNADSPEKFDALLRPQGLVTDLRGAMPGQGFSLISCGLNSEVRRLGKDPIFAVGPPDQKIPWYKRLWT